MWLLRIYYLTKQTIFYDSCRTFVIIMQKRKRPYNKVFERKIQLAVLKILPNFKLYPLHVYITYLIGRKI